MADNIKKVVEDDGTIHYYLGDLHHNPDGPAVIGFAGRHKEYWFKGKGIGQRVLLLNIQMVIMNTGKTNSGIIHKVQLSVLMEGQNIGLMVGSI